MTVQEYEDLKKIDRKEVLNRMRESLDWTDYEEKNKDWIKDDSYMALACFVLWKIKNNGEYESGRDYMDRAASSEFFESYEELLSFLDETQKWKKFLELKDKFSNDELKAVIVFKDINENIDATPEGIITLSEKVLDIKSDDVITEYCAQYFEFSLYEALRHQDWSISAYEDSHYFFSITVAKQQMMELDNLNINYEVDTLCKSDKIFVNLGDWSTVAHAVNEELDNDLDKNLDNVPSEQTYTRDICLAAVWSLKENGRAVIIMRAGQLSGKEAEDIRKFLVEGNYVCGVIALTEKLYDKTWNNTYLLILERNSSKIRFCDARNKYNTEFIKGKRLNYLSEEDIQEIYRDYSSGNDFSVTVDIEEVKGNDYVLLPQRYTSVNVYKEKKKLGDLILDISRGITLSGSEINQYMGKGGVKCVTPASLSNGIISKTFYFDQDSFTKKINYTGYGDLLINKTGKPIKAAVTDGKYVVVGNTYILKMDRRKIDPYYLKCFLESPKGQSEIEKYSVGANTPLISIANLKKIEIPIFDKEKQGEITKKAEEITRQLQEAVYRMDDLDEMFE